MMGMSEDLNDEITFAGGVEYPDHMRIDLTWPRKLPKNSDARRVVTLYVLHAEKLGPFKWTANQLDDMGDDERLAILADARERLGIRPSLKRNLDL
jgi:hypothetical protein